MATASFGCRVEAANVVLVPLPPAVRRAVGRAAGERVLEPLLRNQQGHRMDHHPATRRLHRLAILAGVRPPRMHPHMLLQACATTMLDAGVDLRDVQIAAATLTRAPPCATTAPATI